MSLIRRLAEYFKPHWARILLSMFCMGVVGASAGAAAWLVKPVMDGIFVQQDEWKLKMLPAALLALYLVKGIFRYIQSYTMRWVGEIVILKMRGDLLENFQRREMAFYDSNPTGSLISRVTGDIGAMYGAIPDLIQMLRQLFTAAGLLFVIFSRDWMLASLSMIVAPLAAYPVHRISALLRYYGKRSQARAGNLTNVLEEAFTGISVIKAFGCEDAEMSRYYDEGERLRFLRLKSARLNEATAPLLEFIGAIGAALIIWYGGWQVVRGETTVGNFTSFLAALFMLYDPLKRSGRLNSTIQLALAGAERVFGIMDEPMGASEIGGDIELNRPVESVDFCNVGFAYDPNKGRVLKDISFSAGRGETIALVGNSGGGKSTALKLIPRFYDPTEGVIKINGIDSRQYTVKSLRAAMALVTQNTFLFNDTVRRNILVGRPEAAEEEVTAAATAAHAHQFIMDLPNGYDTIVGERGDMLSGGQKQRVAIARAILRDAPILILDEATSALDSESEAEVQAAMNELMKNRTTFVIAHRLSTVRHANQILVLKDGEIVERGRHESLIDLDGIYAGLCRRQFSHEQKA